MHQELQENAGLLSDRMKELTVGFHGGNILDELKMNILIDTMCYESRGMS